MTLDVDDSDDEGSNSSMYCLCQGCLSLVKFVLLIFLTAYTLDIYNSYGEEECDVNLSLWVYAFAVNGFVQIGSFCCVTWTFLASDNDLCKAIRVCARCPMILSYFFQFVWIFVGRIWLAASNECSESLYTTTNTVFGIYIIVASILACLKISLKCHAAKAHAVSV